MTCGRGHGDRIDGDTVFKTQVLSTAVLIYDKYRLSVPRNDVKERSVEAFVSSIKLISASS